MVKKSVIAIVISVIIALIWIGYREDTASTAMPTDYVKYTITDLSVQGDRFIATVKGVKNGTIDYIDITNATMYDDVKKPIGATLYLGDPSKHHNDPSEFLIIKNK